MKKQKRSHDGVVYVLPCDDGGKEQITPTAQVRPHTAWFEMPDA